MNLGLTWRQLLHSTPNPWDGWMVNELICDALRRQSPLPGLGVRCLLQQADHLHPLWTHVP